ncbi:MAG: hypothetical protein Q8R08_04780, partial [bacterium]|nr:hypothetical protein [bacterium]
VFGGLTIGDGSTTFTTTFGGTSPSTTVDGVFRIRDNTTFVAGSGTVNLKGVTGASFLKTGTFTPNTSTFIYHGVDAISVATTTFYNLSLTPTGTATYVLASGTYSIDNDLTIGNGTIAATLNADTNDPTIDVNRDLVISANSFFTASSAGTLTVARNWSKSGTFTHSSGTVIFDTTTTSVITGATTFNHFTSTTAGKTLQFGNGTIFTFAGTFTITGTGSGSNRVTVNSNSAGNQWTAQFNSAQSAVTYADIKDCGCNGGTANVTLDSTSKNSGNNGSCWVFPVVSTGATGATGTGSGGGTPQGGGGTGAGGGTGGGSGGGIPQGGGGTGGGGGSTP